MNNCFGSKAEQNSVFYLKRTLRLLPFSQVIDMELLASPYIRESIARPCYPFAA
jgi:hypothetical protein